MRLPSKKILLSLMGIVTVALATGVLLFSEMDRKNAKAAISLGPVFVNGKQQYVENEALVFVKPDSTIVQEAMQETQSLGTFSFEDGQKKLEELVSEKLQNELGDDVEITADILFSDTSSSGEFDSSSLGKNPLIMTRVKSTSKTTQELLESLQGNNDIESAEANYLFYQLDDAVDMENSDEQWDIFSGEDASINAKAAWNEGITGEGVVVAVIDSGVDTDHPDLKNNVVAGKDFCAGSTCGTDDDPNPEEEAIHGTHVAGTIAAQKDDSGISGVAPDAKIMPLKVFGTSDGADTSTILQAINYATQKKVDVINMSLGASTACSSGWQSAIDEAVAAGVTVVVAAGNSGQSGASIQTPAICDGVIAVGATDMSKTIAPFSSYYEDMVDVVAPGTCILSTIISDMESEDDDRFAGGNCPTIPVSTGYAHLPGTSMASPHVAGIVALMKEKDPSLSPEEIEDILCENAEDLGASGRDEKYGCGFVNVEKIIAAVPAIGGDDDDDNDSGDDDDNDSGSDDDDSSDDDDDSSGDDDDDDELNDGILRVSPLSQEITVGCIPEAVIATGGGPYTITVFRGSTGIESKTCEGGTSGDCSLGEAIRPGVMTVFVRMGQQEVQSRIEVFPKSLSRGKPCTLASESTSEESLLKTTSLETEAETERTEAELFELYAQSAEEEQEIVLSEETNCSTELFTRKELLKENNTANAFLLEGSDGYGWQRALVTKPNDTLEISEEERVQIRGTAEPLSEVYVFLSSPSENDISAGTCINAGMSDEAGYFSTEIHPRILWGGIGDGIQVSAFFRMKERWSQIPETEKTANSPFPALLSKMEGKEEGNNSCEQICSLGIRKAQTLNPEDIEERLLGDNFQEVGDKEILIGRMPGLHTFSGGIFGEETGDAEAISRIVRKSILMEGLKRSLLGNRNVNGVSPGLSYISSGLLEKVVQGKENVSQRTQDIATSLKMLLTGGGNDRNYALTQLEGFLGRERNIRTELGYTPPKIIEPSVQELLAEIFPKGVSSEENWSKDAVSLLRFWTGGLPAQSCLLEDDRLFSKNFEGFSEPIWTCDMVFLTE